MKHKLNEYASQLIDRLEDMDANDEFRELQEMYETYEDSLTLYCKKIYPNCDVCIWDYDEDYDTDTLQDKLEDILEYISGKTVLDANMMTLRDVLMITVVTKGNDNGQPSVLK